MMEYLLKASFLIGIALLFYKWLLQQETFFRANRLFFLAFLLLAFLLPLVSLPKLVENQGYLSEIFEEKWTADKFTNPPSHSIERSANYSDNASKPSITPGEQNVARNPSNDQITKKEIFLNNPFSWFLLLYFFGVVVFTLNLLFQIANIIYKILINRDKISDGDYVIVNTGKKQAPCSFFNYIFIYPNDYDLDTYEQIIAHEKIHVAQKHSYDLLFAEIGIIVMWFNPLMWMYKRELEKNIEYQTDSILVNKVQVEKDKYQFNLLQIAVPDKPLAITTNYNQSLLKQRIVMMNAKRSNLSSYWKYTFLAPLMIGSMLFLNKPAIGQSADESTKQTVETKKTKQEKNKEKVKIKTQKGHSININISGNEDFSQGVWYGRISDDNQYCLEFKGNATASGWNISRCFDKKEFIKSGDNTFTMTKETGTLKLTGPLDQEVSQGKYIFTKDASFEKYLSQNNLLNEDKNIMFHLFLQDVTRKDVDYLKGKFKSLNGDDLVGMAIHEVDQNYIESLENAGFKNMDIEDIMAAKIHGVTAENIKEMKALGFGDLGMEEMTAIRIHGVDAKYVSDLKSAGFPNLSLDKVIEAKIHGVNPQSIKEISSLGFKNLSLDKIIELKIHDVNEKYISDLKSAGFSDLDLDEIVQAKIHGVDSKSIKEIQSLGYNNLSFEDITKMKLHGVDAGFVADLKNAGFKDLTIDQVIEAKIHDVNSQTIKEIQSLGYKDLSFRKIIEASIHNVDKDFIEGIRSAGIKNPEFGDVISARIHNVDGKFITEARKDGYNFPSLDEYIDLKIRGIARNSKRDNSK